MINWAISECDGDPIENLPDIADNNDNMKKLSTNVQKWLWYRLYEQALIAPSSVAWKSENANKMWLFRVKCGKWNYLRIFAVEHSNPSRPAVGNNEGSLWDSYRPHYSFGWFYPVARSLIIHSLDPVPQRVSLSQIGIGKSLPQKGASPTDWSSIGPLHANGGRAMDEISIALAIHSLDYYYNRHRRYRLMD